MVHVVPSHWSWEEFAGQEIPVEIYSNTQSVELFLNDQSLGTKELHLKWSAPFAPGTLRAVARTNNQEVANRAEPS